MKRTYALLAIAILAVSTAAIIPGCTPSQREQIDETGRYMQDNPNATPEQVDAHLRQWVIDQEDTQWENFGAIGGTIVGLAFGAPAAGIVTGLVNGYRGRRKLGDAKATAISTIVRNVFEATETKTPGGITVDLTKLEKKNKKAGIQNIVEDALDKAKADAA